MHSRILSSSTLRTVLFACAAVGLLSPAAAQTWETCGTIHSWQGEAAGDQFGSIVRSAEDTDGDGVRDVVVGSPSNTAGGPDAGRAYLHSGRTGALRYTFTGSPGENLGFLVNGAGDVDADGYGDVIVGAPDLSSQTPGAAYVFSGSDGSLLYALSGELPGDQYGRQVNGLGDVDADGYADFGVGAILHSSVGPDRGRAYVYSGVDGSELYRIDGNANGDRMGSGIAPLGDRNADGHDDFILGADQGFIGRGRAYVHDGATGNRDCTLFPPATGAIFGRGMLGFVGELTGDGTPDFYVSDFADSQLRGRVRVYDGSDCSMLYQLTGDSAGDTFGTGSGWAGGDIDGDGFDDLVFGALGAGAQARGQLRLFSGATGASLGTINGSIAGDGFGFAAAGAGDLDGDGWPDYLAGTSQNAASPGVVHALSGRPFPPRTSCLGSVNSTGVPAALTVERSLGIAANELRLCAADAPPGELGVFFYGADRATVLLGDGVLCIDRPLFRAGAPVTVRGAGEASLDLDFTQPPFDGGAGAAVAGSSWHFQFWYVDSGGANGSNLSNGIWLTLCP